MNILNEYFDKIYCINLKKRKDRREVMENRFEKFGLDVEFFDAVDKDTINIQITNMSKGQIACLASHYKIIKKSKEEEYQKIFIFEDDAIFSDNFNEILEKNIQKVPNNWEMLYLGGNHLNGLEHIDGNVYRMISSLTTHAYGVKNTLYDIILNVLKYPTFAIDIHYAHIHRQKPSFLIKNGDSQLVWQENGYSDVDDSPCRYDWLK